MKIFDRSRSKKGQAAMEFLMTYGWAILVLPFIFAIELNDGNSDCVCGVGKRNFQQSMPSSHFIGTTRDDNNLNNIMFTFTGYSKENKNDCDEGDCWSNSNVGSGFLLPACYSEGRYEYWRKHCFPRQQWAGNIN